MLTLRHHPGSVVASPVQRVGRVAPHRAKERRHTYDTYARAAWCVDLPTVGSAWPSDAPACKNVAARDFDGAPQTRQDRSHG